jgi:hypothetical protein
MLLALPPARCILPGGKHICQTLEDRNFQNTLVDGQRSAQAVRVPTHVDDDDDDVVIGLLVSITSVFIFKYAKFSIGDIGPTLTSRGPLREAAGITAAGLVIFELRGCGPIDGRDL